MSISASPKLSAALDQGDPLHVRGLSPLLIGLMRRRPSCWAPHPRPPVLRTEHTAASSPECPHVRRFRES